MKDRNDRDPRNYDSRKTKANSRSKSYPATDSIRETKRNAYPLTNDPQRQYNSDSTQRYYNDSTQRQYNGSNAPYNGSTSQYNGSNAYYNGSSTQYNGSTAQYNGSTAQYNGSSTQYNGSTAQYNGSNTQRQYGSTLPFGRIADVVDQYKTAASSNDRRYYDANNSSRRYNGEVLLDVPSLPGNSRTARNGGDPYAPNFSMGDVVQLAKEEHDKNKKRGFFSNFKRSRSPERTLPQYTAPNSYRMIQGQPTIAKVNPYGYVTRNTVGSYHSTGYYDQGYQPPEVHGTGYYKGKGGYNYPPEPEFTHYEKYIEEPKSYSVSDVAGFVVDNRDKKGKNKTAKDLPPPTRTTQLRYDTVEGTNFDSLMMSNPREARNGSTLNNTGYVVNGSTTNAYRDPSYRSTAYNVTRDSRDRNAAYTTQNYYDGKVVSNARDAYETTTVDKPRSVSGMNTVSGANTVPSMNTVSGGNTVTYPRTVPDGVSSKVTDNAVKFNVARDGNSLGTSTQAQEISTLAQQQTRNIGGQALPEGSQSMQVNNVPPPADGRMSAIREEKEPFPPNGKTKNDSSETAVNDAGTNSDTKDTGGPEIKDAGDQPSKDAGDAETESTGDQKIEDNGEMKPDDGGDPEKKEAEHLENTSAGSSQTKETVDTVTNEVTDSKTNSAGGLRANSAGGSRVNSAGGSKTNSAGDSKVNSAEGSKVNSAGGSRANSSRGSKTNSAGGSRANSAGGSKSNSAGGSRANSAGGSKTNSAGGSDINITEGSNTDSVGDSKTNSTQGSKTDSREDSKTDSVGGSKTNSAGSSKTDSTVGLKADSAGGSKTDSAGGSKTDNASGSKTDSAGDLKTDSAGGSKTDSAGGSKTDGAGGSKTNTTEGSETDRAGGSKTSSIDGSRTTSAEDPKTNSTEGSRATSARGSKTNSTEGSDTKEPGDRATVDTNDSKTINGGNTNVKDIGGQTVKDTEDSVTANAVYSKTNATGVKRTIETKAKGDGYSIRGKTKDSGNPESRDLGVKGSGEPIVQGVRGDPHQNIVGTETPSDDANTQKEMLEKTEVKVPEHMIGDKPSKADDEVAPVHTSGETADKKPKKEDNPVENKRSKFGGIFSSQSKKNSGKPIKPPTIIRRSIIAPKFITERIIGKRKMKNVEPSTPNDNESSNSNDKKTKVDSANAEGGDTSPAISNNGKGEPNGADNVRTASDASKPSSSLLTSVDSSKAVSKAKKTLKDKNLAKMSTIPSKSTITDGAVSEKGSLESSGPKTQSKKGSDSPTKLSNEDAKIIEELKSLRSEISKLDSSEGDDDGNDDSNEKGDENTKEKEGGGVQRSRSLIAVTAQENFLIVRGQTPPRSDSSLSLNSKSTKEGETNGDSSDSKIHSQKHELKSDSEATNGEAGEKSEEQTDQSGPKEQTALDQSIPADGEKGSPGAEDSGGKASTEGSGEKSAEGPAVSEGTEKDEEKEGKEDSSDVDKGKEGDSDKVTESEKNPDQVSESDKNKENDDEKEEKSENVNEEEAEKSSEKTSDPEKVHGEGSSDDKEKDSEKDTEKVEKDDKSADKVEAQEDSDEVKEEETKEAGETEKKDQNSEKKDQNSEKKEGSETEDKDKNTDKKDESPEKDGEEKSPSQESDAKSPNSRGDVIVEALEESARSNTGDLADPALAEKTDETEMPFHLKPRGPSMASVERPENVISTVSMAVANNTALGAGTRTVGLGDQLTGGRPYLDRFDASDSLWQKSHGPLEVKPPTELGPNKPVGSLDDEMAQWNNKVKESRGAQTVRIKNQEPRHSILKTTDAKYGNAASKKDEIRPSLKDKALHLSEPIIIASGIVPESLEYLTSEYQAAINGKLNVNAKTGNNTNNGNKGTVLNPLSTTGNKNGNNKVAFNNAFDNSGGGNNYYNINNTSYNNGSNAVPYGQTGVAGYNSYNNANNKIGTMNATNLNPAHAGKEREQFQDRYYDNAPVANGLITAPLAVPQLKGGQAEDVFDRLHNNKKNDRNPGNAPGPVTNTKVDVPPKATTGKEPLDAKATMKAAAKTAATGNAVVAAVNNNKNTSASDANRKNQKNAAGGVVGGGVVGGGGGAGGGGTAAAAAAGGGAGGDVFSRLYRAPKKRSDKVADDKAPSDDAKKDGTKNPVRANNAKGIANAKKGQGDSVINMPLLTPDIVVDDTGDPAPIHGANMGQGGQSGDPTKIPIVLLQGFFRGPGAKSPHHRRPSLAVSEMALPPDLVDVTSMIRGALPVLPRSLAALCLTLNIVVPGLGTMLSGWLGICWGRNRLAPVETGGTRMTSVVVTGVTGLVQLFTVTFFLVGWFWGVAWGILLVSISNKYASFCSEHRSSISGSVNLEMLTVNAS